MTSKGHSLVDLPSAETASSRRSLISALGVAGLAGVAAVAVAQPASAAPAPAPVPFSPTTRDKKLLGQALQIELAAKLLYADAVASGLPDEAVAVASVFGDNHEAYADQFAAITGISANTFDEKFYEANKDAFASGDIDEFTAAAWELENNFAATYTDLFDKLEATQTQTVISSIVVINGRMATVLADLARLSDDFDILFDPPVEILTLPEVTA
jgi:hypothetical protein